MVRDAAYRHAPAHIADCVVRVHRSRASAGIRTHRAAVHRGRRAGRLRRQARRRVPVCKAAVTGGDRGHRPAVGHGPVAGRDHQARRVHRHSPCRVGDRVVRVRRPRATGSVWTRRTAAGGGRRAGGFRRQTARRVTVHKPVVTWGDGGYCPTVSHRPVAGGDHQARRVVRHRSVHVADGIVRIRRSRATAGIRARSAAARRRRRASRLGR